MEFKIGGGNRAIGNRPQLDRDCTDVLMESCALALRLDGLVCVLNVASIINPYQFESTIVYLVLVAMLTPHGQLNNYRASIFLNSKLHLALQSMKSGVQY